MFPSNPILGGLLGGAAGQLAASPTVLGNTAIALNRLKQLSYPQVYGQNALLPMMMRQGLLQGGRLEDLNAQLATQ
jgi:hypothetical protein